MNASIGAVNGERPVTAEIAIGGYGAVGFEKAAYDYRFKGDRFIPAGSD
jgi:hypothetical protein